MRKPVIIYSLILILFMVVFAWNDSKKTPPVDWSQSYNTNIKEPFGLYVLKNELQGLFKNQAIDYVGKTPYEVLEFDLQGYDYDQYVFIDYQVNIDDASIDYLLDYVANGSQVLISAYSFPNHLLDTLQVKTENVFIEGSIPTIDQPNPDYNTPALKTSFDNKQLDDKIYTFDKGIHMTFFSELDSLTTSVLGTQSFEKTTKINYIKIKYGDGYFLLHTLPVVFTNYNLLIPRHRTYASNVLSYLEGNSLIFDDRIAINTQKIDSPLRYILSHRALRWAWFITLSALLIYMIFTAKRQQRIIPIVKPLPNTSIDFAKTIGNLYYNDNKPKDIIIKKINLFLNDIRHQYYLDTKTLDSNFRRKLEAKSGVTLKTIDSLFNYILFIKDKELLENHHLKVLQNHIDTFRSNIKI